jgi:hypothetical protein
MMLHVRAIRDGYGQVVGEPRPRVIKAGEVFHWEGKLGRWMIDLDDAPHAATAPLDPAKSIPRILQSARQRSQAVENSRAAQAMAAQEDADGEAALKRQAAADKREKARAALAKERAENVE